MPRVSVAHEPRAVPRGCGSLSPSSTTEILLSCGRVNRDEECLNLHDFETLEEARQVLGAFIERHGNRTPADVHRALTKKAV